MRYLTFENIDSCDKMIVVFYELPLKLKMKL